MRELNLVRSRLPPSVTALERGDGFPHGSRRHIDVRRSQCLRQTSGGTIGGSKSAHTRRGPLAKCLDHRKAPLLPLEELREEVGQPLSGGPLSRAAARAPCRSMQLLIARPWCRSGDWFEILLHEAVDLRPNRRCANTDTAIVESADPIVARRKAGERDLSLSISRSPPLALCVVSNEGYGCTFQGPSGRVQHPHANGTAELHDLFAVLELARHREPFECVVETTLDLVVPCSGPRMWTGTERAIGEVLAGFDLCHKLIDSFSNDRMLRTIVDQCGSRPAPERIRIRTIARWEMDAAHDLSRSASESRYERLRAARREQPVTLVHAMLDYVECLALGQHGNCSSRSHALQGP